MTDKDIIKALECCAYEQKCGSCPLMSYDHDCSTDTAVYALDLINRQQAEIDFSKNINHLQMEELQTAQAAIEGLRKAIKVLEIMNDQHQYDLKKAKSDAVKEFAERLKKIFWSHDNGDVNVREIIDNLAKEMVGKAYD